MLSVFWCGGYGGTEGGGFDYFIFEEDVSKAETAADDTAAAEDTADLFGCCIGCDIKIFGLTTEHKITDGAAGEVGGVAFFVETIEDFKGSAGNLLAADGVVVAG